METTDKQALLEHVEHELNQLYEMLEGTDLTTLKGLINKAHHQAESELSET